MIRLILIKFELYFIYFLKNISHFQKKKKTPNQWSFCAPDFDTADSDTMLRRVYKQSFSYNGKSFSSVFTYTQRTMYYIVTNTLRGEPDETGGFWDTAQVLFFVPTHFIFLFIFYFFFSRLFHLEFLVSLMVDTQLLFMLLMNMEIVLMLQEKFKSEIKIKLQTNNIKILFVDFNFKKKTGKRNSNQEISNLKSICLFLHFGILTRWNSIDMDLFF